MPKTQTAALADGPAGRPIPEHPDSLLLPSEVAAILGVSVRTLEGWRLRGGGPAFVQISARACRYRKSILETWIASRSRRSTSDPGSDEAGAAS